MENESPPEGGIKRKDSMSRSSISESVSERLSYVKRRTSSMAIPTGAIRASTKFLAHAHDQGAKHQRKVPHVKILPSKVKVRERKERERERESARARSAASHHVFPHHSMMIFMAITNFQRTSPFLMIN